MSTFGNNLIERLRTRLVDVQPQNQLGEGSIALAKNLSIGERENGAIGRADTIKTGGTPRTSFERPGTKRCLMSLVKAMSGSRAISVIFLIKASLRT